MNRFRNWALWVAIVSLAVLIVKEFLGVDISEVANRIMASLFGVLVLAGIINNPETPGFKK